MPLSIECPNCESRYKVGDHLAGKRVKCKKCAAGIHVPDSPNLDKAKELPLRGDEADAPMRVEPIIKFAKPVIPHGPLSDAVIRAEAFVAAELIAAEPVFSAGVGTLVNGLPPFPGSRQTVATRQIFAPEYASVARPIRASTAAPEGFSPLLLLVYVCLQVAGAIYLASKPSVLSSMIWTVVICEIISFFAVVGPCTWLGVWGASKAMRFELAAPTYIKVCAIAVLPGMLLGLTKVLPENPVLILLAVLAILPATFCLTKLLFALTWLETLVTFLLGCVGWTIGRVIQLLLIGAILFGASLKPTPSATPNLGGPIASAASQNPNQSNPSFSPPLTPAAPPVDYVISDLDRLSLQARAMSRSNWMTDASREHMTEQFAGLQRQLEAVRPQANTDDRRAKLDEVSSVLTALETKIAQLPSEFPDSMIYQPITTAGDTWRPGPGDNAEPVSFKRYRMKIPADARIDLASTENAPDGLRWELPPRGKLNIYSLQRKDPLQERPWVRTHSFMKTDAADVFSLDMVNIPVEITYGKMNDLPTTRIASVVATDGPGRFARERFVKYVIADGQSWVVVTAVAEPNDARTLAALENAAWSVHQARGDEPRIDPFTPDAMVSRLRDERAEAIVRGMGAAAEPALLARISDSDPILRARVIDLLGQVGTKKSLPALLLLCSDRNTSFADAARAAVKRISPADMDVAAVGLMDIQSKDFQVRARGVTVLATAQPRADDPRRARVAAILTEMVHDGQLSFTVPDESLGDALAVWQTSDTVTSLLPMLDQKADFIRRKTAMVVLGRMKDKRAAWPIARWLIEDTRNAQAALISMGPVAEDDVLKVLDQKKVTAAARIAACDILAEIGTAKSLKALGYVVSDNKSPGDADAGNAAIAQIRERLGSKAPAATPPGKSPPASDHPQNDDKDLNNNIWIPPNTSPPRNPPRP